jgi:Ca-activated chloride channel homolog
MSFFWKKPLAILSCVVLSVVAQAQHYIRGEVVDEKKNILQNVVIKSNRIAYSFQTGRYGDFGISWQKNVDTFSFSLAGFETQQVVLAANKLNTIVLKMKVGSGSLVKKSLASVTKNLANDKDYMLSVSGESYSRLIENSFITTNQFPTTGFSASVDKAAYSNIRRFLNLKMQVPRDAVRIEEMINYFQLGSEEVPDGKDVFKIRSQLSNAPWNNNQLLFVKLNAKKLNLDKVPPSNLVFLIDVSGSMDMPNRMPLIKSAFKLLVKNLRAKDTVSIVYYGGGVGIALEGTSGELKDSINKAIEELIPSGNTPGSGGIQTAYRIARKHFSAKGNNRVILATDGDFNIGQTSEKELETLITQQAQTGIQLTCLGVGMGNYKDSKLEILSKKGNGNFAYLDGEKEAEKVMMTEFTQTMYSVANDVFVSLDFNPNLVSSYRLIGFDNKSDAIADSSSQLEGGEVGSGHSMVALFEIEPTSRNMMLTSNSAVSTEPIATVKVQYRVPNANTNSSITHKCDFNYSNFDRVDSSLRLAASIAMFGDLLREGKAAKYTWDDILFLAQNSADKQNILHKEFITMLESAKNIYTVTTKKAAKKKKELDF